MATDSKPIIELEFEESIATPIEFNEYIPYTQYDDYELLANKPSIEHVELVGDRSLSDFGIEYATDHDINSLFR